jgi:hypothetical protein
MATKYIALVSQTTNPKLACRRGTLIMPSSFLVYTAGIAGPESQIQAAGNHTEAHCGRSLQRDFSILPKTSVANHHAHHICAIGYSPRFSGRCLAVVSHSELASF